MSTAYDDDAPEGRFRRGFLRDLWPFVRPYRRGFLACMALLACSMGLELLGPWLVRLAVDGPMRDAGASPASSPSTPSTAAAPSPKPSSTAATSSASQTSTRPSPTSTPNCLRSPHSTLRDLRAPQRIRPRVH